MDLNSELYHWIWQLSIGVNYCSYSTTLWSWIAISCISASSLSAYACSNESLGGRALLCQRAIADVIFLLGPNNLGTKQIEGNRNVEVCVWRENDWVVTHVMPTSLRSFSVSVRKILRSISCSSSKGRYLLKPICSRNSARSWHQRARAHTHATNVYKIYV